MPEGNRHRHAERVRALLDELDARSGQAITDAAELVLGTVRANGIVYAAGAGHSLSLVFETFYRAGGLAAVRPIWMPELVPVPDAIGSTRAERSPGLGGTLVRRLDLRPPDVMVVFSTSGRNPYPVEIAQECAARGISVIAVTSLDAAAVAADRTGSRLSDHATVVLDTAVPPGDVVHPPQAPRTAAVSTILGSYVWSAVLAELDDLAAARGVELPRWTSSNVPGGDEINAGLLARYRERVPELGDS